MTQKEIVAECNLLLDQLEADLADANIRVEKAVNRLKMAIESDDLMWAKVHAKAALRFLTGEE